MLQIKNTRESYIQRAWKWGEASDILSFFVWEKKE